MLIVSVNSKRLQNEVSTFSFGAFVSDAGEEKSCVSNCATQSVSPEGKKMRIFSSFVLQVYQMEGRQIQA